ncbi:MAG: HAMP domain-containing histidine kinase, partial [Bdellovibrionales bacterium]|nr:HAMP domain-containing histidine kinase [Bdellovibrionales bacterium]
DIINLVLNKVKNKIDNTNIIISLELEELKINCDVLYVEQVVQSILENAIDALKSFSDIRLISIKSFELDGEIVISINNNGEPISDQKKDKIFTPFFTTKQSGQGVGLGLYLAQNIMQVHEGKINFTSNEKKGTTFNLIFPKREGKNNNTLIEKNTILLFSDQMSFFEKFSEKFILNNLRVFESRSFAETLQIWDKNKIDGLVIDCISKEVLDNRFLEKFIIDHHDVPIVLLNKDLGRLDLKKFERIENIFIFSIDLTANDIQDISSIVSENKIVKRLKLTM